MPVHETDVVANTDGTLSFNDATWIEVADGYFRSADGRRRVGFRRDARNVVTHFSAGSFQVMEKVR